MMQNWLLYDTVNSFHLSFFKTLVAQYFYPNYSNISIPQENTTVTHIEQQLRWDKAYFKQNNFKCYMTLK